MKPRHFIIVLSMLCLSALAQNGYWHGNDFVELRQASNDTIYIEREPSGLMAKQYKVKKGGEKCEIPNTTYRAFYRTTPDGDSVIVLPRLILKLKDGHHIEDICTKIEAPIRLDSVTSSNIYKFDLIARNDLEIMELANQICQMDGVEWCEPNKKIQLNFFNPLYSQQYYLHNTGQNGGTPGIDINVEDAWAFTTGSSKITVAVIDTGVEPNHEDLSGNVIEGYTVGNVTGKGYPYSNLDPNMAHGTACAGIIAAKNNLLGVRGIASGVKILPVNIAPVIISNWFDEDSIAEAIRWAYPRADVLSCSWGGGAPSNNLTSAIEEAYTLGRQGRGCVLVFASGNSGNSVVYPANLPNTIAVGAIKNNGDIWSYSCTGTSLDFVVPSGGLLNGDVVSTDRSSSYGYSGGNYCYDFGGTSAACPQVAGVAALMLSVDPFMDASKLRSLLEISVQDLGTTGKDPYFGHGLVDAGLAVYFADDTRQVPTYTIKKNYVSQNEVMCYIENLDSFLTAHWRMDGTCNMTNMSENYPSANTCTFTKTGDALPTGTVYVDLYFDSILVKTCSVSLKLATQATYRQDYCHFHGTSHPAIPTTNISNGQTVFVHQGCRVFFTNEIMKLYNVAHFGITPDDWYYYDNQANFILPYLSGGIPFVIQLRDKSTNAIKYYYTFFTVSNNGNLVNVAPVSSTAYEISISFDDSSQSDRNQTDGVSNTNCQSKDDGWVLEVYNTQMGELVNRTMVYDNGYILETDGWQPGVYVIHIIMGEQIYTEKIVVK